MQNCNPEIYDYVLIDDDEYIRKSWERSARQKMIKLLILTTPNEFTIYENSIHKEKSSIYIDREFENIEIKGEDFALSLHKAGYKNIFLATGHNPSKFSNLPWLKVIGKEPPWN